VERPTPPSQVTGARSILIVEDYKELRSLIAEILREAGYRVFEAANGAEGLSLLQKEAEKLNLVVTDLAMPGMDGHVFAEEIHQARPDIGIVFMSADPQPVLERAGDWGDGIGLLRKPFTEEELIACVQNVLKGA
jgi:CheY-like chemotaxis protein